jgi:hypothetical protein
MHSRATLSELDPRNCYIYYHINVGSTHLASALGKFASLLCAKSRDLCEDDVAFGQLVEAQLNVIRLESALHKGSTFISNPCLKLAPCLHGRRISHTLISDPSYDLASREKHLPITLTSPRRA